MTPYESLIKAKDIAGGQQQLADICGVVQSAVWKWINIIGQVPKGEYVIRIEAATGISRHDLRPDIYPREVEVKEAAHV